MKEQTAFMELLTIVERGEVLFPQTKSRLIELSRKQYMDAYNLDPELMKLKYKSAHDWYKSKYTL
jgi:hypothetical protein